MRRLRARGDERAALDGDGEFQLSKLRRPAPFRTSFRTEDSRPIERSVRCDVRGAARGG